MTSVLQGQEEALSLSLPEAVTQELAVQEQAQGRQQQSLLVAKEVEPPAR